MAMFDFDQLELAEQQNPTQNEQQAAQPEWTDPSEFSEAELVKDYEEVGAETMEGEGEEEFDEEF